MARTYSDTPSVALSSTTPATATPPWPDRAPRTASVQREHDGRHERDRVLHRGRRAEVDAGAEPLLIDPARSDAEQRDEQQQDRGVDAALGDQPARAGREHRGHAEGQRHDRAAGQPVTQERRGEQAVAPDSSR